VHAEIAGAPLAFEPPRDAALVSRHDGGLGGLGCLELRKAPELAAWLPAALGHRVGTRQSGRESMPAARRRATTEEAALGSRSGRPIGLLHCPAAFVGCFACQRDRCAWAFRSVAGASA
jgi:hypothetical protein